MRKEEESLSLKACVLHDFLTSSFLTSHMFVTGRVDLDSAVEYKRVGVAYFLYAFVVRMDFITFMAQKFGRGYDFHHEG